MRLRRKRYGYNCYENYTAAMSTKSSRRSGVDPKIQLLEIEDNVRHLIKNLKEDLIEKFQENSKNLEASRIRR